MVERLKEAIEKARQQRAGLLAAGAGPGAVPPASGAAPPAATPAPAAPGPGARGPGSAADEATGADWGMLPVLALAASRLQRNRVITLDRTDPAHTTFDVLRSRILKAFLDNGWSRLAITSPTKGCGKTFVAVNLALSFARQPDLRTLLADMDLRAPSVAATLGVRDRMPIRDLLTGTVAPAVHLRRLGENLALALNSERVRNAAELILERRTAAVLAQTIAWLKPDIVIYDLPPMLVNDDAYAFLPQCDAVLLVAAAGETRGGEVEACERLLEGNAAFLGVVLNKVEERGEDAYGYDYG